MKAMGDAERSIATQKRVAIAKPMNREESPEIYTPKRRKSANSKNEVSPPPYIPSRIEPTSSSSVSRAQKNERYSGKDDMRQLIEKREQSRMLQPSHERRELISNSRRAELFKRLGIERKEEFSDERRIERDGRNEELPLNSKRIFEKDTSEHVKNFRITAHVAPSSRLSQSAKDKLVKALKERDRSLKVTVVPSVLSSRGSAISRLGKIVVRRRSENEAEEEKDKDNLKVDKKSGNRRLALSLLGKNLVKKQCEAAVISVQAYKQNKQEFCDSRVVETHSSTDEDDSESECESSLTQVTSTHSNHKESERKSAEKASEQDGAEKASGQDSAEKDSEDLDDMLRDDLDADILDQVDEFTLDLGDDEDLIKVVGQLEEETLRSSKSDQGRGTRFIVTLDGVDERQFEGNEAKESSLVYNPTPLSQLRSPSQHPQVAQIIPSQGTFIEPQNSVSATNIPVLKSAPPKIQPFNITLKDSDDEIEERADQKASNTPVNYPVAQSVSAVSVSGQQGTLMADPTDGMTALQRVKLSERCKFWPACAAGSECEFHHPTTHCKTFPNCKFGDKCLFIHPNCKFDSQCTRPDCPFTHTSKRQALAPSVPAYVPPTPKLQQYYPSYSYVPFSSTPQPTVCKFYPNCHNVNCAFFHPRPCRFGLACQNSSCPFSHPHPSTPAMDKLKWTAQEDHQPVVINKVKTTVLPSPPKRHSNPKSEQQTSAETTVPAVSSTSI